jgi:hypothetical protein
MGLARQQQGWSRRGAQKGDANAIALLSHVSFPSLRRPPETSDRLFFHGAIERRRTITSSPFGPAHMTPSQHITRCGQDWFGHNCD